MNNEKLKQLIKTTECTFCKKPINHKKVIIDKIVKYPINLINNLVNNSSHGKCKEKAQLQTLQKHFSNEEIENFKKGMN